ncbi:MAG: hypothetical protein JNL96_00955 [Planctomycetaceae bacterium]|nr:hypothetical protein [Planctomycetaceae bacterium]
MNTTADYDDSDDRADPQPPPTMISGKWVLIAVLILSVGGAGFGWLWNYNAQRAPREFWGYHAWVLIARGPVVKARVIAPEPAPTPEKPLVPWYEKLVVVPQGLVEGARYIVASEVAVDKAPGISLADQSTSLREALGYHRSYLWESKAAELQPPTWRYVLEFSDPQHTLGLVPPPGLLPSATGTGPKPSEPPAPAAVILFDAECKFVRLQSVDKPAALDPRTAEQFRKFFAATFPDVK